MMVWSTGVAALSGSASDGAAALEPLFIGRIVGQKGASAVGRRVVGPQAVPLTPQAAVPIAKENRLICVARPAPAILAKPHRHP